MEVRLVLGERASLLVQIARSSSDGSAEGEKEHEGIISNAEHGVRKLPVGPDEEGKKVRIGSPPGIPRL